MPRLSISVSIRLNISKQIAVISEDHFAAGTPARRNADSIIWPAV